MYATGKFGLLVNLMERPSFRDHNVPVPEIRIWVRARQIDFRVRYGAAFTAFQVST